MNKVLILMAVLLLAIIGFLGWALLIRPENVPLPHTTSTSTAAPAPTPTTTTIPAPAPLHSKIVVTYPKSGAHVPKNFTVTGKAPGGWFFEGSAPVMLQAEDGSKIAVGTAQALEDWTTKNPISFKADITSNPAYSGPATLVLLKDNPSGLPENDDSLEISIVIQ